MKQWQFEAMVKGHSCNEWSGIRDVGTIERRSSRTSLLENYKMLSGYESGTIDCNSRELLTSLVLSDWSPTSGYLPGTTWCLTQPRTWHNLVPLDTLPGTWYYPITRSSHSLVWKAVYVTSSRTNCNWNNVDSNYAIQMWHLLPPLPGTPIQVVRWALIGFFGFALRSRKALVLFKLLFSCSSYSRWSLRILGALSSYSRCSPHSLVISPHALRTPYARHSSLTEL